MKSSTYGPMPFCCLEDRCFDDRTAFFMYDPQSPHFLQSHQTIIIYPHTFLPLFANRGEDGKEKLSVLKGVINKCAEDIAAAVKEKIFGPYLAEAEAALKGRQTLTPERFAQQLMEENYDLLGRYKAAKQRGDSSMFQQSEKETADSLQRIYQSIQAKRDEVMDRLFSPPPPSFNNHRQASPNNKENKIIPQEVQNAQRSAANIPSASKVDPSIHLNGQQQKNYTQSNQYHQQAFRRLFGLVRSSIKLQPQISNSINQYFNHPNQQSCKQEADQSENSDEQSPEIDNHQKQPLVSMKTKPIEKQRKRKFGPRFKPSWDGTQNIKYTQDNEAVIYEIRTPQQTKKSLQDNKIDIKAIQIFDKGFVTTKTIKTLFEKNKHLETLIFNCNFRSKVFSDVFSELCKKTQLHFKKICFRWDLQRFYKEYFVQKYFPTQASIQLPIKQAKELAELIPFQINQQEHLWLYRTSQLNQKINVNTTSLEVRIELLQSKFFLNFRNLLHLKIYGAQDDKDKMQITPLECPEETTLSSLLDQNKQIRSLFFHNIQFNKGNVAQRSEPKIYQQLYQLPNLICFSLIWDRPTTLKINAVHIKRMNTVEYLYLQKVEFTDWTQEENVSAETFLFNLRNLKHLSLYKCSNITSEQINKLHSDCYEKIELLNLGQTRVDQNIIITVSKMKNLLYLNLQKTVIKGRELIWMLDRYKDQFKMSHPLKYLNIKTKMFNWKAKAFSVAILCNEFPSCSESTNQLQGELPKVQKKVGFSIAETPDIDQRLIDLLKQVEPTLNSYQAEKKQTDRLKNRFTAEHFQKLVEQLPNLEYLNITHHFHLVKIDLRKLSKLKILRKDKYVTWGGKLPQGARVIEEYPHEIKPYPS